MLLIAALALASAPLDVTPAKGFTQAAEPSVAISPSGEVYVAFGQGTSVFVSRLAPRGKSFDQPVRVVQGSSLALGMRRGPRIVASPSTIAVSAVMGERGGGRDGDLLVWASTDRGATWRGPSQINDAPASAREGLHAMAYGGNLFAATWLDLREKGTRLVMSTSPDGLTWSENVEVYRSPSGSICECCHPSLAIDGQGRPTLMFRNSLAGDRDMYLIRTRNGRKFDSASKLGKGSWELEACPMDGGAVALDSQGTAYTVWRRKTEVYASEAIGPEKQLGRGLQPWVAVGPTGPVYVWLEKRAGRLMLLEPGQAARAIAEQADDPVVTSSGSQVVVAWTDLGGGTRIRCQLL